MKETNTVEKVSESIVLENSESIKIKGSKAYDVCKRIFDVVCSLLAMICLSWLFLIVIILIRCSSKGPAIYVSDRIGKDGKVFKFYKFRTMYDGADKHLDELLKDNEIEGGVTFKMKNDPRVTTVGKFLRRTSIDELPQLWNILKGDMTIVGPRPCTVREYELYTEHHKKRLVVPQGLTGEWQANGRSATSFDEMIEMDLAYITEKRGFFYDLLVIFKTVTVMFTSESGAQ